MLRVYGLAWFLVKQLPLGISCGLLEIRGMPTRSVIRCRLSMLGLRANIAILVGLVVASLFSRGKIEVAAAYSAIACACGLIVYWAAVQYTKMHLRRWLASSSADAIGDGLSA
jgi:hypothetical protein